MLYKDPVVPVGKGGLEKTVDFMCLCNVLLRMVLTLLSV